MFTGIINVLGTIVEKKGTSDLLSFQIEIKKKLENVKLGSSIAINGVCLTLTKRKGSLYEFDVMKETVDKTTLSFLKKGEKVHIEPSLKVGDEIGGHFVYGHVDGIGKVSDIKIFTDKKTSSQTFLLTIIPPKNLFRYFAPQGSITLNGVSLTIAKLTKKDCTVSLIPFTLQQTNLIALKKGDIINIECDMLAKYIFNKRH